MTPILATITSSFVVKEEYLDQFRLLEDEESSSSFEDELQDMHTYAAESFLNYSRNRYDNILPYQANIFRFQNPTLYFNASRVLQGRVISCQGPLKIEHSHFWRMVWESHTTAVIMTTDLVEKSSSKCSWYLPRETGAVLSCSPEFPTDLEVHVKQVEGPPQPKNSSKQIIIPSLIERRLELEYKGEIRIVYHYHFMGWGDFRAAPESLLAKLVTLVWEKHYSKGEHLISHCSAGVGRSGTFLTILEAFSQLKKEPPPLDFVLRIVRNLRSHANGRKGMVQTREQYGLIFKTLALLDGNCAQQFCIQSFL
jgi:protein tyrosine phosphatase